MLFAVTGCTSLLGLGGGPPPHLYRLPAAGTFPGALPHVSAQLLIDVPQASAGLDTRRIALSHSPVSLDYFADSAWTDRISALVQTALVESFENSHAIPVVGRNALGLRADFVLRSEIRHFEAEYRSQGGAPRAFVAIMVTLVRMPAGEIVDAADFAAKEPAAANTIPDIIAAFAAALDNVMQRIVVWTLTNPALSAVRR